MPKVASFVSLLDANETLSVGLGLNIRVFSFNPFNLPALSGDLQESCSFGSRPQAALASGWHSTVR